MIKPPKYWYNKDIKLPIYIYLLYPLKILLDLTKGVLPSPKLNIGVLSLIGKNFLYLSSKYIIFPCNWYI